MSSSTPRNRRRAAARRRFRPTPSAVAALVLPLLAAAAVVAAGVRPAPPSTPPSAHGQPVTDVLTACPQGSARARILAGSIPASTFGSSGRLRVRPVAGAVQAQPVTRGRLISLAAERNGTVLETTGAGAPGSFGVLLDPDHGTLSALRCTPPRATWWFTGAGATLDHTSELVIANVDAGPAVVDVRVLGRNGPVDSVGTRGITVPPHSVHTVSLTDIAPQGEDLAVEVHASRGRVAAAVSDSYAAAAGATAGRDWLPDQQRPSRVLRVAATPGNNSKQTLLLANPSPLTALVGVRLQGRTGAFAPTEHAQVEIPPGSTRAVDLTKAAGRGTAALLLHSRVPVLASVRSMSGGDTLHAGAVPTLEDPAAVAWTSGDHGRLLLTGGQLPSSATVAAYDQRGKQLDTTELRLTPRSTVTWKPPAGAVYLTVSPEEGQVHGAVLVSGRGVAELPLVGLPMREARPVVRPGPDQVGYSSP